MKIAESTAFITGANRGLGRRFAEQLVARGATVYGGVRKMGSLEVDALEAGSIEILADENARQVQANLSGGVARLYSTGAQGRPSDAPTASSGR